MGKITFRPDKTFNRIDFQPIKLMALESNDAAEMIGGSVVNADFSMQISSTDSLTLDEIEQVKFMINIVDDSVTREELIKLLKNKNIPLN